MQYAHARICSVFKQLPEKEMTFNEVNGIAHLSLLTSPQERQLLNILSRYREVIVDAALNYEPQLLINYLRDLAGEFHAYYNSQQFLVEEHDLRDARLALIASIRQILVNGFGMLNVSAPESM